MENHYPVSKTNGIEYLANLYSYNKSRFLAHQNFTQKHIIYLFTIFLFTFL